MKTTVLESMRTLSYFRLDTPGIVDILHLSMLYTSLKVPKKLVSLTKRFDHTTVVTIAHQQTPIDAQMTN